MKGDTSSNEHTNENGAEQRHNRFRDPREPLDFSPASTATDPADAAQDQSESIQTSRHAYTENATFMRDDIPAKSDQWQTLNQANRDFYVDELSDNDDGSTDNDSTGTTVSHIEQARRQQDHINDTVAWGKQIGLTDYEIERAVMFVLGAEAAYKRNFGIEAIILAALTLAANEGQGVRGTHPRSIRPNTPIITDSDDHAIEDGVKQLRANYQALRDDLGVDGSRVKQSRKHIRSHVIYTTTE